MQIMVGELGELRRMLSHGDKHIRLSTISLYEKYPARIWVAREKGLLIGVTAVALTPVPMGSITIVRPEWRNRGIGTALVREKIKHVHCLSVVAETNPASRRMLEKAGASYLLLKKGNKC